MNVEKWITTDHVSGIVTMKVSTASGTGSILPSVNPNDVMDSFAHSTTTVVKGFVLAHLLVEEKVMGKCVQ